MKLIEKAWANGMAFYGLEDIIEDKDFHKSEIFIKNLTARQTNPRIPPHHDIVVWIDDEGIAQFLKDIKVNVTEVETEVRDENGDVVGHRTRKKVTFRAYPKLKPNRMGKMVPSPRVMTQTPSTGKWNQYDVDKIGQFDTTRHTTVNIQFHTWEYDPGKAIARIDEIWCVADEKEAVSGSSMFAEKYGYSEEDLNVPYDDEVPFD